MKNALFSYLFFILLIILSCTEKDQAKKNSSQVQIDSAQLKNTLERTMNFIQSKDLKNAEKEVQNLKIFASDYRNDFYSGKSYSILGYLDLVNGLEDSAFLHFHRAKDFFTKTKDSINLAKVLGNMAIIQSNQGDYFGSESSGIEALNYIQKNDNLPFLVSIYNALAISSGAKFEHEEAIYWYRKAVKAGNDPLEQKICWNNIAVSYSYLENYSKSDRIFKELLADSIVLNSPNLRSKVLDNFAYSSWKKNPNHSVENQLNLALNIRIETNDQLGQIASHSHLSDYLVQKNTALSLYHAKKMYELARKLKSPNDQLEALKKLINLENNENSKLFAIDYAELNDSLTRERNIAKNQFAKIKYDSERNREENQSLKLKNVENQLRIQRQNYTTIFALLSSIILCSAIGFLYIQQRNKRKRERLEAAYESEVKMAKKVHDVVANDLHTFIVRLQNLLAPNFPEKEKILSEIESIYESSRNISHEFQAFDKHNFNSEIKYLLTSFQSDSVKIMFNLLDDKNWENIKGEIKVEIFRVLQEVMTNMRKHSQATLVLIEFKQVGNEIKIIYRDNGIGFSKNAVQKKSGIANTENRMENINGSITFEPNQGNGLRILISFPI